ncbi:MAG: type IV pilin protein, partial [Woeseiaceae bacterium]
GRNGRTDRILVMQMRKYMRGVTLMELMIVVVIIGVLTAIAFPNYREFVARAKRAEAKAALLKIATNQEKFYLQNQRFGSLTELGYTSDQTETGAYTLTVSQNPSWAVNFRAQADYNASDNEGTKCSWFRIDGGATKTSYPYTDCWTRKN